VVLLTAGDDAPTKALVAAVQSWAGDEHVDLRTLKVGDDPVASITKAMTMAQPVSRWSREVDA
jgi:hypothetical protein